MAGLFWASGALAAPFQNLAAIDSAVADFVGVPASPVDRRLRLAPCNQPLAISWFGSRQDTVEVRCPANGGWLLYVPLASGTVLPAAPPAIQRGDGVTILAGDDSFTVSQPGEALESGATGAWIKVRPLGAASGSAPLRAKVLRPGQVGIVLP